MTATPLQITPGDDSPRRLPKKTLPPFIDTILLLIVFASGVMLFLAVPNIIDGGGWWAMAKAATLSLSAIVVSFGVNKLAIERGAPLTSTGFWGAAIASVGSILAVGGGLFAATYSGLVFNDVAALRLQEHGQALTLYVGERSAAAAEAGRAGPALQSVVADLVQKRDCEAESSCISGRGSGGRGPVTRALEATAGRALVIGQQIAEGEVKRQAAVASLNRLLSDYQQALGDEATDMRMRRATLQSIDAEVRQHIGALDEAMPLALLTAYADELKAGAAIPAQPQASEQLSGILSGHGRSLAAVLDSIEENIAPAPAFPKRTGVADTFGYMAHFLPVAAITMVVELVFPLTLWIYTLCALNWEIYRGEAAARSIRAPTNDKAGDAGPAAPQGQPVPALARATRTSQRDPQVTHLHPHAITRPRQADADAFQARPLKGAGLLIARRGPRDSPDDAL